jgi:hypothetical protein
VALGVSLHVDDAQLHVGLWEQPLGDGEQPREVVLDNEEHAAQAPLDETAQDELPVFGVLPPWPGETAEDPALAVTAEANHHVDAAGAQPIAFPYFDVLAIDEKRNEVGVDGSTEWPRSMGLAWVGPKTATPRTGSRTRERRLRLRSRSISSRNRELEADVRRGPP